MGAADANNGTVVGDAGVILRTTDGGNTWRSQSGGAGTDLRAVFLTDPMSGWVAGNGGILHTVLRNMLFVLLGVILFSAGITRAVTYTFS